MAATTLKYAVVIWTPSASAQAFNQQLNALGADGREAVGMSPRSSSVPMPGMGADADTTIAVLLKREIR